MDITFDSEARSRIRRHVTEGDALFFAMHPDVGVRIRMAVPYEVPIAIGTTYVLVCRIDDNCHLRIPIDDALARHLSFLRPSALSEEEWAA